MKMAVVGIIVVAGAVSCTPGIVSDNYAAFSGTGAPPHPLSSATAEAKPGSITLQERDGIYLVPVTINDAVTLEFVVDSGAADVSVSADVVSALMRTGAIKQSDFLDTQTYRLADGSVVPSARFRIRSLKVGETTLENVIGTVALYEGGMLLGQSFLGRFKSWSIDNTTHALVLE
jgi:clan AA aspartic protease (TIGR02281 family)